MLNSRGFPEMVNLTLLIYMADLTKRILLIDINQVELSTE